jgi:hypothetical protein
MPGRRAWPPSQRARRHHARETPSARVRGARSHLRTFAALSIASGLFCERDARLFLAMRLPTTT